MEKDNRIIASAIIALGIIVLGFCLKGGIDNIVNKGRVVTVKGLSERDVQANSVTWPIKVTILGQDITTLYQNMNRTKETIMSFLTGNGIDQNDISVNPPAVNDRDANRWGKNETGYRYDLTLEMTVKSKNVEAVRNIISRSGELLEKGIVLTTPEYGNYISYDFTDFQDIKLDMMREAIKNAEAAAKQFADNSNSKLGGIETASQGQFSIENRDETTPYIKTLRVITTVTYSLKD